MTSVICFALRARPPVSVMRREIVMTGSWFKIRQLTDVYHCNLQHCFPRNWHLQLAAPLFAHPAPNIVVTGLGGTGGRRISNHRTGQHQT